MPRQELIIFKVIKPLSTLVQRQTVSRRQDGRDRAHHQHHRWWSDWRDRKCWSNTTWKWRESTTFVSNFSVHGWQDLPVDQQGQDCILVRPGSLVIASLDTLSPGSRWLSAFRTLKRSQGVPLRSRKAWTGLRICPELRQWSPWPRGVLVHLGCHRQRENWPWSRSTSVSTQRIPPTSKWVQYQQGPIRT